MKFRTLQAFQDHCEKHGPPDGMVEFHPRELLSLIPPAPPAFTERELATVLAALHMALDYDLPGDPDGYEDFLGRQEVLSRDEIATLIHRLDPQEEVVVFNGLGERSSATCTDCKDSAVERYRDVPCPSCHGLKPDCGRCRGMGTVEEMVVDGEDGAG